MWYSVVYIFRVSSVSHHDAKSCGNRNLTISIPKNTNNYNNCHSAVLIVLPTYNSPCNGRRPPILLPRGSSHFAHDQTAYEQQTGDIAIQIIIQEGNLKSSRP